jgi:23S rRNA pseudouridine1911/1915/1917 synthase
VSEVEIKPLLDWLLRRHPDTPKGRAKKWILAGRVSVHGVVCGQPHERIADPGDALVLRGHHATTLEWGTGWQIHPRVALLYLDAAVAIVNKAPGLISVPAPNTTVSALSILADFMAGRIKPPAGVGAGRPLAPAYRRFRPLPVHRLDRDTSGVFCMATHPAACHHLIEQLKAHTLQREYVAFVDGRAPASQGTWRHWLQLSRDELRQHVFGARPVAAHGVEAQEAITHYEVIAEYRRVSGQGFVTKLRLRLETGRKHQIRAQAAHMGLPLIGDRKYHPAYRDPAPAHWPIEFPRQALHAAALTLEHPTQPGTRLTWTAELPHDLRQLQAILDRKPSRMPRTL